MLKLRKLFNSSLKSLETHLIEVCKKINEKIVTLENGLRDTCNSLVELLAFIRVLPALMLFCAFSVGTLYCILENPAVFDFVTCLGLLTCFFFITAFGYVSLHPIKTLFFFTSMIVELIKEFFSLIFLLFRFLFIGFEMLVKKYTLKYTLLYILLFCIYTGVFLSFCYLVDKDKFFWGGRIAHIFLPEFFFQDDNRCLKNFFKILLLIDEANIFIFIIFSLFVNIYVFIFVLEFAARFLRILIVSLFFFVLPNFDTIKNDFILNKRKYLFLLLIFCFKKFIIWVYDIYLVNYFSIYLYAVEVIFYSFLSDFLIGRAFNFFSKKHSDKSISYVFSDTYDFTKLILYPYFLICFTIIYIFCTPQNSALFCYHGVDYQPEESILEDFILKFIPDYEELLEEILYEPEETNPDENTNIKKSKP